VGKTHTSDRLQTLYEHMLAQFGPQQWWPADSPFEVMVGAILTQNTNWKNVERAIGNIKDVGLMTLAALSDLPVGLLAEYIRPAGYYNIKAARLHNLFAYINEQHEANLEAFLSQSLPQLREQLLTIKGIGRETADSILLYAAGLPIFVVDAYTHRILTRHQVIDEDWDYDAIQELFMDNLACDASLFNEYHALIVQVGKQYCKKTKPDCAACPLNGF
jgi:endonuclease-3 related protein